MSYTVVILMHKIVDDRIVSTVRDEKNSRLALDMVMRTYLNPDRIRLNISNYSEEKVSLNIDDHLHIQDSLVIEALNENEMIMYERMNLNFPTLTKCQNCETNFPTKYQYQRHQCDFDVNKVVFKTCPDDEIAENITENKKKTECEICGKFFASKINLEKHQETHSAHDNICEFCAKRFVSENRLRIHKENHCKKAGDVAKFYRSDVTVWKCRKCHEVFSSAEIAVHHVEICQESGDNNENKENFIEKISTEILLQCEFCNRTYSDKNLLLMHQRKHTTAKNYECVNCLRTFDSFCTASSHWLKKCTEFSNLFYLPRLSYCEYCDRTFKSHDILYNHKTKKKHYTPKLHSRADGPQKLDEDGEVKPLIENKDIVNKLIEDVLKTLEVPVNDLDDGGEVQMQEIKVKIEPGVEDLSSSRLEQEIIEEQIKPPKKRKLQSRNSSTKPKKHASATDEGFKYQCERCIKVFSSVNALENHRNNEHAASFCCEECNQTLPSAKALLIHCRAHKSLKPYVCDTCGRSYSQTSHLWQHMRFHQGIKPFACPHEGCEARYTIRPDLKDHIRKVHTRERPFKCNVCNKCFLTGSVYYQHRLIHTNDRRYGCEG
ncbi:zinc finger protein 208 isoform X2 [Sitophilus oryzae]|uniref:Zinc finger protein 208 isoform X2 n=1 Tax=Sitophilus oryzae TaxID=7048 RepID=A0A6J2XB63_SITOR|nr:zinc finger protein 208 isoform X2 [Sitophilus oryzae]